MSEERKGSDYVSKVQEGTRRYTHELLSDNENLRRLLARSESERNRLEAQWREAETALNNAEALKSLACSLGQEKVRLQERLTAAQEEVTNYNVERQRLQRSLATVERENQRHYDEHSLVEQQNSDLANLYVASYRLHGSLDRTEVLSIMQEIIANLIGCEEAAVFEFKPEARTLDLIHSFGIDPAPFSSVSLDSGLIGRCGKSGELFVAESGDEKAGDRKYAVRPEEASLTACIPLKLDGRTSGAIALFRLLPQKIGAYVDLDREIFDLLATHAATALYCSALHAEKRSRAAA